MLLEDTAKLSAARGARLKRLMREGLGMKQADLATLLHVSQGYVSELINGKKPLTGGILLTLAREGVSLDWLLWGDGAGEMLLPVAVREQLRLGQAAVEYGRDAKENVLARLRAVIRAIETELVEGRNHDDAE